MNYPKPDILNAKEATKPSYISVPQYKTVISRSNVSKFEAIINDIAPLQGGSVGSGQMSQATRVAVGIAVGAAIGLIAYGIFKNRNRR